MNFSTTQVAFKDNFFLNIFGSSKKLPTPSGFLSINNSQFWLHIRIILVILLKCRCYAVTARLDLIRGGRALVLVFSESSSHDSNIWSMLKTDLNKRDGRQRDVLYLKPPSKKELSVQL